ncbi:MAG: ABC transporter permease [Clostridiales bacterium]|nr:ABC transporter permease [Clostridiales bacterium]
MMGVMIGAGAIIIMISLGLAMNRNFLTQLSQMGNLMQIQIYYYGGAQPLMEGESASAVKTPPKLDDAAILKFEQLDGVECATPLMDLSLKALAGKYVSYMQILGIKADVVEKLGIKISEGTTLNVDDPYGMIIGKYTTQNFYKPNPRRYEPAPPEFNLMKEKLTLSVDMMYGEKLQQDQTPPKYKAKPQKVHVLGIIAESGGQFDYTVLMPIDTVKLLKKEQDKFNRQNSGGNGSGSGGVKYSTSKPMDASSSQSSGYTQAIIKVKDIDHVSSVLKVVKDMGYEAYSPIQMLDDMKKQASGLQQILGGIGAMALLIAAIGIANTMYMSIYERTREIGIIKVIGARLGDIRRLFMMEAAWTGIFGGIAGVLFSIGTSLLLNASNLNLFGSNTAWVPGPSGEQIKLPISYIPVWLMAVAFGFAIIASLAAGFLPARRAMKLSVMRALHQD